MACLGKRGDELARKPGLPDPGRSEHRDEPALVGSQRFGEGSLESGQLVHPADQGGIEPAGHPGCVPSDRAEPVGAHRIPLALERQGRQVLDVDRVSDKRVGGGTEQHLPSPGRLLEPLRRIDRVAGDQPLARHGSAGDHLAGIDADPEPELDSRPARVVHETWNRVP